VHAELNAQEAENPLIKREQRDAGDDFGSDERKIE
jgi:hypothetical protein